MMRLVVGLFVMAASLGPLAGAVAAEEPRYGGWQSEGSGTQELVDELRLLIDEADRARAADPRFLRDLKSLVRRFDRPWRVEILRDDFRDGDYAANPAWTVTAGRFEVEWGAGLRSVVRARRSAPSSEQAEPEDLAAVLLGALLQEAQRREGGGTSAPSPTDVAAIHVARPITNAFAIRLELRSGQSRGRLEFGPYQGYDRRAGYRLAYAPGGKPALELLRVYGRRVAVVEVYDKPLVLEDGSPHFLEWTRHPSGDMAVWLDGRELMTTIDRGLRNAFDGFTLVNLGGDFAIREIVVAGTE